MNKVPLDVVRFWKHVLSSNRLLQQISKKNTTVTKNSCCILNRHPFSSSSSRGFYSFFLTEQEQEKIKNQNGAMKNRFDTKMLFNNSRNPYQHNASTVSMYTNNYHKIKYNHAAFSDYYDSSSNSLPKQQRTFSTNTSTSETPDKNDDNNTLGSSPSSIPKKSLKKKPAQKKKLKTNQLGQKGQNRVLIKKEREKKRIEKEKLQKLGKGPKKRTNKEKYNELQDTVSMKESDESRAKKIMYRPPSMILPTGSPNVYVSRIACEHHPDVPYRELFSFSTHVPNESTTKDTHVLVQPKMFRKGYFDHFPRATHDWTPLEHQPEVAFLGRSNVGKSSLINALLQRPLAITSKQPGRTQQAYYYGYVPNVQSTVNPNAEHEIQNSALGFIVDLPGYGYAVGPTNAIEKWQSKTQDFLIRRREANTLKHLFLLQDARTGALPFDLSVQNWMDDADIPYSIVLTKCDSVGPSAIVKHANLSCIRYHQKFTETNNYNQQIYNNRKDNSTDEEDTDEEESEQEDQMFMSPFVYVTSAKEKRGIVELLTTIEEEFSS